MFLLQSRPHWTVAGEGGMDERKFNIAGLLGFMASGAIFVVAGIRAGDLLTIIGSVVWIGACIVWIVPLVRPRR